MAIYKRYQFFILILLLFPFWVIAQISQGGIPIQLIKQKSTIANSDLVVMPAFDIQTEKAFYSRNDQNMLKPLHFAHPFKVSFTPKNSGEWYSNSDINIWQLRIRSVGAYSLNLIFDQFNLPENARLFLISSSGEVKGAYTSVNNSESKIFAIEPVEGDEITVQYEEPTNVSFAGEFQISQVAHDFLGVGVAKDHRPLGESGKCNVNVNCDAVNGTENIRDAVCRLFVAGIELCTGSLLNNTSLDGSPYLITAYHCINTEKEAQSTVFLFNYESPYCSSVDGDVSRSMSGSSLKSSFDSLDFALVRLNTAIPFNYRPYLAGWNRKILGFTNTLSIHHPLGDIKKVSVDFDAPISADFNSSYLKKGFWNVRHWELGVTEAGSSGGPLFDQNRQFIGSLTGGAATCTSPTNDYFAKFALAWDHRPESNKQLKYWLDPLNSNLEKLDGMPTYSAVSLCKAFTNFKDNDIYAALKIKNGITAKGYWSGTNLNGYTDFAEQYKFSKNCVIQGITLGVAKVKTNQSFLNSYINVQVFEGKDKPEKLLYTEQFNSEWFYTDGMNYLKFASPVKTTGNFFVSYNISQMHDGDTLAIYMANRTISENTFFLKNSLGWESYNSQNENGFGSALLTELIVCNVDDPNAVKYFLNDLSEAKFFPNPLSGNNILNVTNTQEIQCPEEIFVIDLLGKQQDIPFNMEDTSHLKFDFSGKRPGIYFIHLQSGGRSIVGKIAYIP